MTPITPADARAWLLAQLGTGNTEMAPTVALRIQQLPEEQRRWFAQVFALSHSGRGQDMTLDDFAAWEQR